MAKTRGHFYPTSPSKVRINAPSNVVPARVVDIILDEKHPSFTDYGDIGAIRFRLLGSSKKESSIRQLGLAYPMERNVITYPLLEEIVYLYTGPIAQGDQTSSDTNRTYYGSPLAIWITPHMIAKHY